jgi:hypothetical protein
MRLDQDALDYGYILKTLQDGSWWHMHIARSAIEYHCVLLGKNTSLLLNIQSFLPGVWANSPEFILTLDGEGVDLSSQALLLDSKWGLHSEDKRLQDQARSIQRKVLPIMQSSPKLQDAIWEIMTSRSHLQLVDPSKLKSI